MDNRINEMLDRGIKELNPEMTIYGKPEMTIRKLMIKVFEAMKEDRPENE